MASYRSPCIMKTNHSDPMRAAQMAGVSMARDEYSE